MAIEKRAPVVPDTSGIYQIRCTRDGKIYVGSAVDLRVRWNRHRRALREGTHHNAHLQSAWTVCGKLSFEFEILEYVPEDRLLDTQQKWIDLTDCTHRQVGYNICALASSQGQKTPLTWRRFRAPDGNSVSIVNLRQFCRSHDLDFPSMHRLARGVSKLKSYKGWTHENSVRKRDGRRRSHKGWTWRDHDESQTAQWRRVTEAHESPDIGNQPLSATTRS